MNKKMILIIIFISALFSTETIKFIFWNSEEQEPLYGKSPDIQVRYKIRINNEVSKTDDWILLRPKKLAFGAREKYSYDDETYSIYRIEEKFNDILTCPTCEDKKIFIDFKIKHSGKFYAGTQTLLGEFWDYEPIDSDQAMTYGLSPMFNKNLYFSNSEIIQSGVNGDPIIRIISNPPRSIVSGTLREIKSNQKIEISRENIKRTADAQNDLILENININKDGKYSFDVQVKPDADNMNKNYELYIIAENYYSQFINIDNNDLLNGKDQTKDPKFEPRYPFSPDSTINPSPQKLVFYNTDCMRWICKDNPSTSINESKTQIYIKKINKCVDKCSNMQKSQITNGKHECIDDLEAIEYFRSIGLELDDDNSSYDAKFNACVESYSNNSKAEDIFPINSKKKIAEICRKEINSNIPENEKYKVFIQNFFYDYEGECEYGDYIEESFCNNMNKSIANDYYFLIKLSNALYKNIRLKYNDDRIKTTIDEETDYFNEIERLILLYNRIDHLEQQKSGDYRVLKENHADGDVPDYVYLSIVANHYIQRVEFYRWYFESLFYLNKMYTINGHHRVFLDIDKDQFDLEFLCKSNTIPNSKNVNVIAPSKIKISEFMKILQFSLLTEIDNYSDIAYTASKNESYRMENEKISDYKKHINKLMKELD